MFRAYEYRHLSSPFSLFFSNFLGALAWESRDGEFPRRCCKLAHNFASKFSLGVVKGVERVLVGRALIMRERFAARLHSVGVLVVAHAASVASLALTSRCIRFNNDAALAAEL